jgi:hypothetical protein
LATLSSLNYSQNIQDKYDETYGIFYLKFEINEKGNAKFKEFIQVQCEGCSPKLIETTTIDSFYKSIDQYSKQYAPKTNGQKVDFKLPIIFKIADLEKEL